MLPLKTLIKETLKGKSLGRLLLNNALRDITVGGIIADLGSGRIKPSYHRFINLRRGAIVISLNITTDRVL